ncbi:hypothetical protein [Deinococcus sp. PEB2-63]
MTANDSKSTPKKAERHPLELLADYVEAANRHLDAPSYSGVLEEAMNDAEDALLTLDPAALRAQAEAEAGVWLILWEPGDPYENGGVEDGAWRTEAEAEIVRARLEAEERANWAAYPGYSVKTYMLEFRPFALAQAGGDGQ